MPLDAISTTTRRWTYTGDGVTTAFGYNNYIVAGSDLEVYLELIASPYTQTLQTLTTHYTVSGAGTIAGGNVTFVTPPASTHKVVIVSKVPNTQPSTFDPRRDLAPDALTAAYHRLAAQVQQLAGDIGRSPFRIGTGDSVAPAAAPAWRSFYDKVVVVGAAGALEPSTLSINEIEDQVTAGAASATAAAASASAASGSATAAATSATNAATSETNAAASAARLQGTSTSSVAIGTGSKSFTTQSGKFFDTGKFVLITDDAAPSTNWMFGQVTAYTGTSLTVNVLAIGGSGTKTAWTISLSGAQGATGAPGAAGADGASVVALTRNLIAKNNSGTPNSIMDVTADTVVLMNASNASYVANSVSISINIASSGANGLDTGAEAGNTWYYLWIIYNGSTVAGLISTSATAPTMPSGYTYKALIGAVRNDGSSNFVKTWISERKAQIANQNVLAATAVSSINTFQSLSISSVVPPMAKTIGGTFGAGGATPTSHGMRIAGSANGEGEHNEISQSYSGTASNTFVKGAPFDDCPLITAQTLYWTANTTDASSRIDISKYTF